MTLEILRRSSRSGVFLVVLALFPGTLSAPAAFGGQELRGITILTKGDDGRIVRAAIHHRPLGAALRFSAELGRRLDGAIPSDYFHAAA